MKCFFAFCVMIFTSLMIAHAQEPTAKVQLSHNAADPLALSLDIYLNDELYLDDFQFRTATEFRDFIAGTEQKIGIALGSSQSASDIIVNFTFTFSAGSRNALMINGVISPTTFAPNPDPTARPINILATRMSDIREMGLIPSQVDVLFWHGASDLGAIDVYEAGTTKHVSALSYGYAADYFRVNSSSIPLTMHRAGGTPIETYLGNFGDYIGQAVMVVTSGFSAPGANNNGPPLGLYLISADGGPFSKLPPLSIGERAFVQIVNNVADVDHGAFDVWINDILVADNLAFRKATMGLQVTPNTEVTVSITDTNATSPSVNFISIPYTFTSALHMLVLNGLVSTDGYAGNSDPNAAPIGLDLHHVHDLKPGTTPDHVEAFAMNGSTDAPELDMHAADGVLSEPFFEHLSYGEATPYTSLPLEVLNFVAERSDLSGVVGRWQMDCAPYVGKAIAVITTGFLNSGQNKNGPNLQLMLVFDDGQTVILNNSILGVDDHAEIDQLRLAISPNPSTDATIVACELPTDANVSISIFDGIGVRVSKNEMGLQPAGSLRTALQCSMLSSGMYNVVIEAGSVRTSIPLWIVR